MSDTRRYAVWPDPRSSSRSRRSEICENDRFQSLSPPPVCVSCNQKTIMNYDTPRQYLNCNLAEVWNLSSYGVTWPSEFRVLRGVDQQSRMELIYYILAPFTKFLKKKYWRLKQVGLYQTTAAFTRWCKCYGRSPYFPVGKPVLLINLMCYKYYSQCRMCTVCFQSKKVSSR